MKGVFIKWHRGDQYERKQVRKIAVRSAWRTVRQRTRLQLQSKNYCEFMHPRVRLGYFD